MLNHNPTPFQPLSLYVHIPFCQTKCTYCAFNTYTGLEHLISPYLSALGAEMGHVAHHSDFPPAHTLYFGGGTPSLLQATQVEWIIEQARSDFRLADGSEITLETNPGDGDLGHFEALHALGVTRISIGVQSAHERDLKLFRRRHTFADARATFDKARQAGFDNISVDLIYGAPGQTLSEWSSTLDAVLAWRPDHVSLYSLSLEENTIMTRQVRDGVLPAPDSDLAADMYDLCRERLRRDGFVHYEISNWAKPGRECVHNLQYWLNEPFVGFGAGAHGYVRGQRYWNVKAIPEYIRRLPSPPASLEPRYGAAGEWSLSPVVEGCEAVDRLDEMSDTVILGLRLLDKGVSGAAFVQRFGVSLKGAYGEVIDPLEDMGLLFWETGTLYLTPRAYLISNQVFYRFARDVQ